MRSIVVQYMYELKDIEGPQLESTKIRRRTLSERMVVPKKDAVLTINIRDIEANGDIWRLSLTRRLSDKLQTQEDYNKDIAKILKKFPPKEDEIKTALRTAARKSS